MAIEAYVDECSRCGAGLEEGLTGLCDDCMETGLTAMCGHCDKVVAVIEDIHGRHYCAEVAHDKEDLYDFKDEDGEPVEV